MPGALRRVPARRYREGHDMNVGVFDFPTSIDEMIARSRTAASQGFGSYWLPQIFGIDALTAIAVVAREVDDIMLGTAVVPTFRQHPMAMAQQALTVNQAAGGRLQLGIGLSHQLVVEDMWGLSYDKPLRHMREYLDALLPLLRGEPVSTSGEVITANGGLDVDAATPPVLIAALGPKMLELAGRVADGTATWMVGPATLAAHIAPTISAAADDAGRDDPQVVVGLPVCVTDDPDAARAAAAAEYAIYGHLPSYRSMLDREGAAGPEDIAIIGTAAEVTERIAGIFEAGGTCFVANEFGSADDREATRSTLIELLGAA